MRIASLLPAATEIVCALGAEAELVCRSHECDFPPSVAALPSVTSPRVDPSRPGPEIHASVQSLLKRSLAIYDIDVEALARCRPDVIVTQDQCAVCAVPLSQVEAAARRVLSEKTRIVSLSPMSLDDVRGDFRRVAEALHRDESPLLRAFNARLDAVRRRPRLATPPRVLGLEWLDPPMAAGNWFAELLEIAGGVPAVPPTARTEQISWEAAVASRPDLTVVVPCGFPLRRAVEEFAPHRHRIPGRICAIDANAFINRPGPRLADSAEILADALRGAAAVAPDWAWIQ